MVRGTGTGTWYWYVILVRDTNTWYWYVVLQHITGTSYMIVVHGKCYWYIYKYKLYWYTCILRDDGGRFGGSTLPKARKIKCTDKNLWWKSK